MVAMAPRIAPSILDIARAPAGAPDDLHAIVASNRGPLDYEIIDGRLEAKVASGGVITALTGLTRHIPFTWVAAAQSEAEHLIARGLYTSPKIGDARLRLVPLPREVYHCHYGLFSNPLLWFVQHSLASRLTHESLADALGRGWTQGYVPANLAFAQAIAAAARADGRPPVVLLHDYHLYLVAGYLRRMLPGALLQHFVHIPWPRPQAWLLLPAARRLAVLRSLLHNDIVGFQTGACVAQFLRSCAAFVPRARIDHARAAVTLDGHTTLARAYPIAIDHGELRDALESQSVLEYERRLQPQLGELTIVRVDRLDPSKDVANGFRAFARLLEQHPQWQGRVRFLAFLVPSRSNIPEYRCYADETFAAAGEVNARFGRSGYRPVEIYYENNRPQALAGLKCYDVLLVNSLADGMNLVAKEGPIANRRDGVLVLSSGAGAHEQLRRGALSVMPGDVAGIAAALSQALAMPPEERGRRATLLRRLVEQHDVAQWAAEQLAELIALRAPHAPLKC